MVKLLFPLRNPTELEMFVWGRYLCEEMNVVEAPFCADVPPAQIFAQVERPHLVGWYRRGALLAMRQKSPPAERGGLQQKERRPKRVDALDRDK
ncbi:hypothetical protein HMPREF0262_03708 [Clostridium sp. ATCC 29733]|nr:hypothetical protein HMPREF0262_03708 [Clostridium sp. ATCC 29733]